MSDSTLGTNNKRHPRGISRFLTPLGIFLLAIIVRAMPWPSILAPKHLYFFGNDAYYHMRRILYTLANFPKFLDFDPYINFPQGAKPIWSPMFDTTLAWLVYPFYQPGHLLALERVMVWVPVLLGAATVLALYFLAKRYFGYSVAWLSALFLSFLTGHFWYSQIGFLDHHAAVALVSTLLLASAMGFLRRCSAYSNVLPIQPPSTTRSGDEKNRTLLSAVMTGLTMAFLLLLWPGGLLFVGFVEAALFFSLISRSSRKEATWFVGRLTWLHAAAFLLVFPFCYHNTWPQWSDYSPVVLTRFQPWFFAVLMIHHLACWLLWRRTPVGRGGLGRTILVIGIGLLLIAVSIQMMPEIRAGIADSWRWLTKQESFQSLVNESKPLFFTRTQKSGIENAERLLSRFMYLFPILLIFLARSARKRRDYPAILLLIGWSVVLAIITLLQKRFMNSFSVVLALVMGWSCVRVFAWRPAWLCVSSVRRRVAGVSLIVLIGFLLWPIHGTYKIPVLNMVRKFQHRPIHVRVLMRVIAARWLRANTPAPGGFFDASHTPDYGVLADWGWGHLIEYVARRPTAVDNFGDDLGGDNFRLGESYFRSEEREAVKILDRLHVRYIFAEMPIEEPKPSSMVYRMYYKDPGFRHHRLLYMTPLPRGAPASIQPVVKIFEYVKGARLTGFAPPGHTVTARLNYRFGQRRDQFWTTVEAGQDGRYSLQLPYSTRNCPPSLKIDDYYLIESSGRVERVVIDEQAVQTGAQVAGPDYTH